MLTYDLSARGSLPRYEYLYRCLRRDILSGVLPSGARLPSKRAFAEHLGVSVITVESAYAQLLAEGMIESRARRGYFAAARALPPPAAAAAASEDEPPRWRLDLRSGRQDAGFFPAGIWSRLTRRVLAECPSAPLGGVPHEGLYELREAIAAYLRGEKALSVEPNQIIIGAGSEFLYLLLAQLFSGAVIALEDPGYPKIREVYTASGAVCVPAALDAQGVSPASLESGGAAVLHISPSHQFPTGAVTPVPRRQALLELMGRRGGYIIEDDYASELGFPRAARELSRAPAAAARALEGASGLLLLRRAEPRAARARALYLRRLLQPAPLTAAQGLPGAEERGYLGLSCRRIRAQGRDI